MRHLAVAVLALLCLVVGFWCGAAFTGHVAGRALKREVGQIGARHDCEAKLQVAQLGGLRGKMNRRPEKPRRTQ